MTRGHREVEELEDEQPLRGLLLLLPQRLKHKHGQCAYVQPSVTVSTGHTAGRIFQKAHSKTLQAKLECLVNK